MKTAQEYAEQYLRNKNIQELKKIAFEFLEEVQQEGLDNEENGKIKIDICPVIESRDKKWREFARLVKYGINPDGFSKLLKKHFLVVYMYWQDWKKDKRSIAKDSEG